ncbi:hypothetical protein [Haloferula sp. BvORR071]|uniref:hypothetical protein n=1 Tax=Haloferula sp. BvORR071 TaxID=1396141 RepID=UPI000556313A|nr:hypothetical protein [Haloferula sp. BvORR071]
MESNTGKYPSEAQKRDELGDERGKVDLHTKSLADMRETAVHCQPEGDSRDEGADNERSYKNRDLDDQRKGDESEILFTTVTWHCCGLLFGLGSSGCYFSRDPSTNHRSAERGQGDAAGYDAKATEHRTADEA